MTNNGATGTAVHMTLKRPVHCHRLETLLLEEVCDNVKYGADGYPPLIKSSHQMPPFLRLVTLGIGGDFSADVVSWRVIAIEVVVANCV